MRLAPGRLLNPFSFFGVLLTGLGAIVGVFPLFPKSLPLTPSLSVGLFVGSLLLGQVFHVATTRVARFWEKGHRQFFANTMCMVDADDEGTDTNDEHIEVSERLVNACDIRIHRSLGLPVRADRQRRASAKATDGGDEQPSDGGGEGNDDETPRPIEWSSKDAHRLYPYLVSHLYINGRGLSLTVQGLFSFSRNILGVLVTLFTVYLAYLLLPFVPGGLYNPKYTNYQNQVPDSYFLLAILGAVLVGIALFWMSYRRYRKYLIEYVIADFVVLESTDDEQTEFSR